MRTSTLLEGCIGETVAAVEALEASLCASDEHLRLLLLKVSEDESRHAELAYRAVGWLLEVHPELQSVAQTIAAQILATEFGRCTSGTASDSGVLEDETQELLAVGILSEAHSRQIRERVLADVVEPCLSALLAKRDRSLLKARVSQLRTRLFWPSSAQTSHSEPAASPQAQVRLSSTCSPHLSA